MDLGTAIIGAFFISLVFLPIVLMVLNGKKKEKKMLQLLHSAAHQQNGHVSKHELFGDFAIGIDDSMNLVFYVKQSGNTVLVESVNLAEIQSCKVLNSSKFYGEYKTVEQLDLCLTGNAKNRIEIKLPFFAAGSNNQIREELKSIENWSRTINDQLKKQGTKS